MSSDPPGLAWLMQKYSFWLRKEIHHVPDEGLGSASCSSQPPWQQGRGGWAWVLGACCREALLRLGGLCGEGWVQSHA